MGYPCVHNDVTRKCELKNAALMIHFGILQSGRLQVAELVEPSPWGVYDEYSMNAIKLAQPFPPIPPALMAALEPGSAGMPIMARFRYEVYTTLRSILE
jgi:hypothetical protein